MAKDLTHIFYGGSFWSAMAMTQAPYSVDSDFRSISNYFNYSDSWANFAVDCRSHWRKESAAQKRKRAYKEALAAQGRKLG